MLYRERSPRWPRTASRVVWILGCSILMWGGLAQPAAEAADTVCVVRAHQPHPSGHFGGRINAIGELSCRGDRIPDLHLDVQVQRKVGQVWKVVHTTEKSLTEKPMRIEISRSLKCVTGIYRAKARLFGFGRHHTWARSAPRSIICGAGGGGGGGGGGSW